MKKVTLDRELFLLKLGKTIKFIPSKTIIPAFDNALLSIKGNSMDITASNGNTMVKVECQVSSTDDFSFCVPAKLLYKTISLFSENKVVISMKKDDAIEVKSGKSKYSIGLDCFPQDFPVMSVDSFNSEVNMRQFDLKTVLDATQKFVDENNQNANMTALKISEVNNKMVFIGLTTSLMCRASVSPISITKWEPVCIGKECASKVVSLLGEKGEVTITNNGSHISFFTDKDGIDGFEVVSTAANVKFPNTEPLFAKERENKMTINALELTGAVKRLELYASSDPAKVVMKSLGDEELLLNSSDNLFKRDGEEIVSISNTQGNAIDKKFGIEELLKILANVNGNEINMHFSDVVTVPSFITPKVNSDQEDIFSFLIAQYTS